MTLTAGGAGFAARTAGGRPRAGSPGCPFIEVPVAAEDAV